LLSCSALEAVLKPQLERETAVKPEELLYAKTHEWVHLKTGPSGEKIATVGISGFALEALTDLVFVDLPEVGRQVEAKKPLGEIESVKAVSDIYSPVDGEIIEVNAAVPENLEKLPGDPYGFGWLVKIKVTDESGLSELMDFAAYQRQCAEEENPQEN
jgi:glycine cleavage system H protein